MAFDTLRELRSQVRSMLGEESFNTIPPAVVDKQIGEVLKMAIVLKQKDINVWSGETTADDAVNAVMTSFKVNEIDGEYIKFWKRFKKGNEMVLAKWPVASIKVGTPSWDEFQQVFPDWDVEYTEGENIEMPIDEVLAQVRCSVSDLAANRESI